MKGTENKTQTDYPKILTHEDNDFVVFFDDAEDGVVVYSDDENYEVGYSKSGWDMSEFNHANIEVTMTVKNKELKSHLKRKENTKSFPKMMKSRTNGAVVLFESEGKGVIILSKYGDNPIGTYSSTWTVPNFQDMEGKVTLEND